MMSQDINTEDMKDIFLNERKIQHTTKTPSHIVNLNKLYLKNYFSIDELKKYNYDFLYNLFKNTHLIVFISNKYLDTTSRMRKYFCAICRNIKINFNSCRDITFLPHEFKFQLLDLLRIHNNKVDMYRHNNIKAKNKIIFDDGMIKKGVIYKRLKIQNAYTYIPLDKYEYKLTEYNIRGFCQIMEELGANKIEIDFSKVDSEVTKLKSKNAVGVGNIAGNLGFSLDNSTNKENKSVYILEYPDNNNLILNAERLKYKIDLGDYLVSTEEYNSNLELQYVILSRCRHFITNYSTTFNLKIQNDHDLELVSKLNIADIKISSKNKYSKHMNNNMLIETRIYFNNDYRSPNQLLKDSISLDEVGFNYIMNNINKEYKEELPDKWIIFIWRFINLYCYSMLNIQQNSKNIDSIFSSESDNNFGGRINYENIQDILEKIKNNFSLEEIINILKKYFNIKSQMKNLHNFIYILDNKTKTYDELGLFLVIENNKKLDDKEKTENILNFLVCKEKSNKKLKEYLQVYNEECIYQIYDKFNKYGIFNRNNWESVSILLSESNKYEIVDNLIKRIDEGTDEYNKIFNNFNIGLSTHEFYEKIIPLTDSLLYKKWNDNKDLFNIKYADIIRKSIHEEAIYFNNILSFDRYNHYIDRKIIKFNKIIELKTVFEKYIENNENISSFVNGVSEFFQSDNEFLKENNFIVKKYNIILSGDGETDIELFLKNIESNIFEFGIKLLLYNERLNIRNITLDKYGFNKIRNNMINGIFDVEFHNLWKPFILKYINFHQKSLYSTIQNKYSENSTFFIDYLKEHIETNDLDTIIMNLLERVL